MAKFPGWRTMTGAQRRNAKSEEIFNHARAKGRELDAAIPNKCQWFFLCPNPATTTLPHPILDSVPCCQSCADKNTRLSA